MPDQKPAVCVAPAILTGAAIVPCTSSVPDTMMLALLAAVTVAPAQIATVVPAAMFMFMASCTLPQSCGPAAGAPPPAVGVGGPPPTPDPVPGPAPPEELPPVVDPLLFPVEAPVVAAPPAPVATVLGPLVAPDPVV